MDARIQEATIGFRSAVLHGQDVHIRILKPENGPRYPWSHRIEEKPQMFCHCDTCLTYGPQPEPDCRCFCCMIAENADWPEEPLKPTPPRDWRKEMMLRRAGERALAEKTEREWRIRQPRTISDYLDSCNRPTRPTKIPGETDLDRRERAIRLREFNMACKEAELSRIEKNRAKPNTYYPHGLKYHVPRGTPKFEDYLL